MLMCIGLAVLNNIHMGKKAITWSWVYIPTIRQYNNNTGGSENGVHGREEHGQLSRPVYSSLLHLSLHSSRHIYSSYRPD